MVFKLDFGRATNNICKDNLNFISAATLQKVLKGIREAIDSPLKSVKVSAM